MDDDRKPAGHMICIDHSSARGVVREAEVRIGDIHVAQPDYSDLVAALREIAVALEPLGTLAEEMAMTAGSLHPARFNDHPAAIQPQITVQPASVHVHREMIPPPVVHVMTGVERSVWWFVVAAALPSLVLMIVEIVRFLELR